MNRLYIIIGGFLAGMLASLGVGGGSVLILLLTMFLSVPQLTAGGINLLFFIPIALLSVIVYHKRGLIKLKQTIFITAFGLVGVAVGTPLSNMLGNAVISRIFGVLLIAVAVREFFSKTENSREENS